MMISKLGLSGFKSFSQHQELKFGNFSLLLGTNASGKSNVGDALRFLHGISRGYTLLEIMNEKRGIGGELIWKGIRGGVKDSFHRNLNNYKISLDFNNTWNYQISVSKIFNTFIDLEILVADGEKIYEGYYSSSENRLQETDIHGTSVTQPAHSLIQSRIFQSNFEDHEQLPTSIRNFLLDYQLDKYKLAKERTKQLSHTLFVINKFQKYIQLIKFFDLNPEAMRSPSLTGQTVLGEQGENLSSVLHAICEQEDTKANLLEWLGALTPTDATHFKFYTDPYTNKVLAILIESNGQETSLYSASDGTLRFLAILAALFSPTPASLYFFEEIENGIHPSRLYLLVELLEERAKSGIQIIATTHSPQLLSLVSQTTLENSSLIYRAGDHHSSQIMPILEIPNIKEILEKQEIAKLYATGWFEDIMEFMQEDSQ